MQIKKITNRALYEEVIRLGSEDAHDLTVPTHVVLDNDGKIAGALSIIPTVSVWLDTKKVNVRQSIAVGEQLASHFSMQGEPAMMILCPETSPFRQLLEKYGLAKANVAFSAFWKLL